MINKNIKTAIDLRFEHYLYQENISSFEFEPFGNGLKNPDYLICKGKSVLVEVKEIESIPLDYARDVGSMDVMGVAKIMMKKISEAKKQLKPHINKANYAIILLGKTNGFDLNIRDLEWAMYGDPVFRIQLDVSSGKTLGKPYFDMKVKGIMRKNNPITKQMYFPLSYISAIGIIKQINGYDYYLRRLYEKYKKPSNKKKEINEEIRSVFQEYDEIKNKYEKNIPKQYLNNRNKSIYYLDIIANALSYRPLPRSFFSGEFDRYKIHKVKYI